MERIPSFRTKFLHKLNHLDKKKYLRPKSSPSFEYCKFISQKKFYPSYELAHDDGDDVVVIMCVNDPYDDYDCVHSKDENKVRMVDMAQSEGTEDYLRNQGRTILHLAVELLGC